MPMSWKANSLLVFYNFNAKFTLLLLFKVHSCTPAPVPIISGQAGLGQGLENDEYSPVLR